MPEREKFGQTFGGNGFSVDNAELVDVNSFLDSNPDEVTQITKEEAPKKTDSKNPAQPEEKKKVELQVKPLTSEELFPEEEEVNEETNEEDETSPLVQKKVPEKKEVPKDESTFSVLTKELLNLGVFTAEVDEEGNEVGLEINSPEDFLKQFQSEVKKQTGSSIQKFLERFGPEYEEMFQAVYVNGVPPYEYISRQAKIENIEQFDVTNEDNQEKIVRQWYKSQGIPQERIEAKVQKLKNYGDLEEEAGVAKEVLVDKEQKDLSNLAAQKQQETQRKNQIKQDYTTNIQKIVADKIKTKDFDGIPVDRKFAEQTYNYLTKDVYQTPDKQLLTEFDKDILDLNRPENNGNKVKLAMLLQLLKSDPTLSKLGKRAVSKESNKIFSDLERKLGKSRNPSPELEERVSNW